MKQQYNKQIECVLLLSWVDGALQYSQLLNGRKDSLCKWQFNSVAIVIAKYLHTFLFALLKQIFCSFFSNSP